MPHQILDVPDPDIFANGFPHAFFRELRAEEPVFRHEGDVHGGSGYWIVSKYDGAPTPYRSRGLRPTS